MKNKTRKFSNTQQRRIILDELRKTETHPSADELYEAVRRRIPQVSLGTVYRNLNLMSQNGQIRKLELSARQKRFDGRIDEHYHIRCPSCGSVRDLESSEINHIDRHLNDLLENDKIQGYRLELIGKCSKCK